MRSYPTPRLEVLRRIPMWSLGTPRESNRDRRQVDPEVRCPSILHCLGGILARPLTIAIDGPVAAGKTTVGRRLSSELRYRFLDTGILYRALTWLALDLGIDLKDEGALGRLAWSTSLRLKDVDDETVTVDGREVSAELRGPDVDRGSPWWPGCQKCARHWWSSSGRSPGRAGS